MGSIAASGIAGISKFDFKEFAAKNSAKGEDKFLVLGNELRKDGSQSRAVLASLKQSELPFKGHTVQLIQPLVEDNYDSPVYQNTTIGHNRQDPVYQNTKASDHTYENAKNVVYSADADNNREIWDLFRNYISDRYSGENQSLSLAEREIDKSTSEGVPLSLRKVSQIIDNLEASASGYSLMGESVYEDMSAYERSQQSSHEYENIDHIYEDMETYLRPDSFPGSTRSLGGGYRSDSGYEGSTESINSESKKAKGRKSLKRKIGSWIRKKRHGAKVAPADARGVSNQGVDASRERLGSGSMSPPNIPLPQIPGEAGTLGEYRDSTNPIYESAESAHDHLNRQPVAGGDDSIYEEVGTYDSIDRRSLQESDDEGYSTLGSVSGSDRGRAADSDSESEWDSGELSDYSSSEPESDEDPFAKEDARVKWNALYNPPS